jgi:voltage-gated potassium channel
MAFHYPRLFLGIVGDSTLEEVLEQAQITTAKGLITALPSDSENVFIALTARGMNQTIEIISRAEHDYNIPKLLKAGANHVILPNLMGGRRMVNVLTRPGLVEFVELITGENNPDSHLHIETIDCEKHPMLWGKTLSELHLRSQTGLLVVGRKQKGQPTELNPGPKMVVEKNDRLYILGAKDKFTQLDEFLKSAH